MYIVNAKSIQIAVWEFIKRTHIGNTAALCASQFKPLIVMETKEVAELQTGHNCWYQTYVWYLCLANVIHAANIGFKSCYLLNLKFCSSL